MSTRATVHFHDANEDGTMVDKPEAIIYRHGDGYPEGLGADLKRFVQEINAKLTDKRFHDPAYLAARWVVWDAHQMLEYNQDKESGSILAFLSVGICKEDPGDIEYRYHVVCDGKPTIWGEEIEHDWDKDTIKAGKKVEIPDPEVERSEA